MAKANFESIKTNRASVGQAVEMATGKRRQQSTASPAEAAQREAEGRTQGRKGCKAPRINVAFTAENYEYIREMAALMGVSMTKVVNMAVEQYKENNAEGWQELRAVREKYKLF